MAPQSSTEQLAHRFAPYILELHELFASRGMHFGSPKDIVPLVESLDAPGSFSQDLASMVRAIIFREGGAVPRAELLQIVAVAIGGPQFDEAAQTFQEPVRRLLTFINGVVRAPWNSPPGDGSPSQHETQIGSASETSTAASHAVDPVIGTRKRLNPREEARLDPHLVADLQPDPVAAHSAAVASFRSSLSTRRIAWILGACALVIALAVATLLRPRSSLQPAPNGNGSSPLLSANVPAAAPSAAGHATGNPGAPGLATRPATPAIPRLDAPARRPNPGTPGYGRQPQSFPPSANRASTSIPPAATPAAPHRPLAGAGSASGSVPYHPLPPHVAMQSRPVGPAASRAKSTHQRSLVVSSGIMAGNLVSAPVPGYPILAEIAHIQGQVILQAVISKDGSVVATHVLRGHRLLRGAAVDAVRRWRYRPYIVGGRPVDVATIVTVDFRSHR